MASNQSDILTATDAQQTDGALLVGGNGNDLIIADGTQTWTSTLVAQNGSGVAGTVTTTLTDTILTVQIQATGLEPNQVHQAHIHGLTSQSGAAETSSLPFEALDRDADGFIELNEGRAAMGPPVLDLTLGGQFPNAAADGTLNVTSTFNLDNLPQGTQAADLFPLDLRTVELHGLSVTAADGRLTGGEVNGTAGYKPTLPVAAADLTSSDTTTGTTGAVLRGDNGNDHLIGAAGTDLLLGGLGNDVLAGAAGNDQLVGGSGNDTFIVGQGNDVVVDFGPNQDKLTFADTSTVQASSTSEGTVLSDGTNSVMLMGVHTTASTDLSSWFAP